MATYLINFFCKRLSATLAILSMGSILLLFIMQLIALNVIGPGDATDALFLGLSLPTFILSVTVTALNNVLVPFFSGKTENEVKKIAGALILVIVSLSLLLTTLLYVSIDFWLPYIASGFYGSKYELTKSLTQLQLLVLPLALFHSIQWAMLNAQKKHLIAEFVPFIINLLSLFIFIIMIPTYGVWVMAVSYPVKFLLQIILLQCIIKNYNFKEISRKEINEIWGKLKPVLFGSLYYKSEPVIDRGLLTLSPSGTLSLFHLAQQIFAALTLVLVRSLVTPAITLMSESYKKQAFRQGYSIYKGTLQKLFIVTLLIVLCGLMGGDLLTNLMLNIKKNHQQGSDYLYYLLIVLSGSFIGNVCGVMAASAFYAVGNTTIPSYVSIVTYTIYIPIKIVVFITFHVWGLAIVISAYSLINLFILVLIFKKTYLVLNEPMYVKKHA